MYAYPTGTDPNGLPIKFADLLGSDHTRVITCTLIDRSGNPVATPLTITGGDVTVDKTAQVRRSLKLSVAALVEGTPVTGTETAAELLALRKTLVPDAPGSTGQASPYGSKVVASYGILVPNGISAGAPVYTQFDFALGTFWIASADVDDDGHGQELVITGYDSARKISRNKLTQPWIVAASTNWGDAIYALAADRLTGVKTRAHAVTTTSPATVTVIDPEADPWDTMQSWAALAGCEVYFDASDYLTIVPISDLTTSPTVWTYDDGGTNPNTLVLSGGRTLSDDPGYNGVILTSTSTTLGTTLRSEAWDNNPNSPTYYLGPYGRVPKFVPNDFVATQVQADAAAAAELLKVLGSTIQNRLAITPNPAHEAGDVIQFNRPAIGAQQTCILQSFVVPFKAEDSMTLGIQERRAAS